MFCRLLLLFTALAAVPLPVLAAEKGDILVRLRAFILDSEEDGTFTVIGGEPKLDNPYGFEIDVSYFFTNHLAVEAIVIGGAQLRPQAVGTILGDVPLGSVLVSPAALTAQYHFMAPQAPVRPYLGAGVNYAIFTSSKESAAITDIQYDNSIGVHVQAGADIRISDRWSVNLDVKRLWNSTEAFANGQTIVADVDIDPWIYGIGVGYRF